MKKITKSTTLLATGLSLALFAALAPTAQAEETKREAVIIVTGTGKATVTPDMALINLSVVKQAKTAREALTDNNKSMTDVLAALKAGGIADKDLQTSGFSINAQYSYPQNDNGEALPPVLTGYQVSNGIAVRVRDLSKLGDVVDQAVTLGINQSGDIIFTNDKPDDTVTEARKLAVSDAMAKAKVLADAAGVKVGRIIEMSETSYQPDPQPIMRMAMAKESADASVPVAPGENAYTVTVNVTFGLNQE